MYGLLSIKGFDKLKALVQSHRAKRRLLALMTVASTLHAIETDRVRSVIAYNNRDAKISAELRRLKDFD